MKRALLLASLSCLAGCAGPRAPIPEASHVAAPSAWRSAATGTDSIDVRWWSGFGDPTLGALVEAALAHNDDIAIAAARVAEARAQFHLAHSAQLPTLSAVGAGDRERYVNAFGKPTFQTAGEAELSASYDLDLFGRLANSTAAAKASLLASQASYETVRLAIVSSTASGYITLRALDARLDVLQQTLKARAESLHIAERRAHAGYSTDLELRQAQAEYHATEQLIPAAELAIRKQEDGLSILIGSNPRAIERGVVLDQLKSLATPEMLPSMLLRRRPDIAQAEQQVVAADRTLDSARAAFMPQIQLSAAGGYVASSLLGDPIGIFSLGGSILAPLFTGGRLTAQADAATARRDQAAFSYQKTALSAFRDVEDALAAIQRNREQELALMAQRDSLAAALRLATNRYRSGYATYLDQLDAERGLLSAELTLVQARSDILTAQVSLYQSLGGGWSADLLEAKR